MRLLCITVLAVLSASLSAGASDVVDMLVPGFTVQELPVRLSNINNLRFAPDGRLTALGYDGRIWLLSDTDRDGIEDNAEIFWDKSTLNVPVGMCWNTHGLYVSSRGKVSLIRDADRDGKGDSEETIASGWPATDVASGGVDATAVTLDKDGNVYFGLLVADYSNAYRLRKRKDLKPAEKQWLESRGDKGGDPDELVSLYDIHSQRGTIQKWDPRTRKLETIATGIRVPFALAFNKAGDLFNTDQEGETWMPDGNPLDELNHIVPGRNYGFPPRHDQWLPQLVSEPPVVSFGPQHQSTCGLVFNEPRAAMNAKRRSARSAVALPAAPAQGLFGPKWWEGDAFVAGESRGKIWRVRLVKTPHGYVGKEFLIARLSMLTMDLAISPRGELYVCCHSGPPDWGTGPRGEGRVFKISYTDRAAPQPVWSFAAGSEMHVQFDRPLQRGITNRIVGAEAVAGRFVAAGDEFETLKPPYEVVKNQAAAPRTHVVVTNAMLSSGRTELVLHFNASARMGDTVAISVPEFATVAGNAGRALSVDAGAAAAFLFTAYEKEGLHFGVVHHPIPHLDTSIADAIASERRVGALWQTAGGRSHRGDPFPDLKNPARLRRPLSTVELSSWLRLPAGTYHLHVNSDAPVYVKVGSSSSAAAKKHDVPVVSTGRPSRIDLSFEEPNTLRPSAVSVGYSTPGDPTVRPLPFHAMVVPWGSSASDVVESSPAPLARLLQGDFERGRDLFFGERLKCSTCHRIRSDGAPAGPDLSNLVHRDTDSILRDIRQPSASINPDHVAFNIELHDGSSMTALIRDEGGKLILTTGDGKQASVSPVDVARLKPSAVSLMPEGLLDGLSESQITDLLTFVATEPPKRSVPEIKALSESARARKLKLPRGIVVVATKQDHGAGQHDYPAFQESFNMLRLQVPVSFADQWPSAEQFVSAKVIVFYFWNHHWTEERLRQLDAFLERGGGAVLLHSATIADKEPEKLSERIGLAAQPGRTGYRHMPFDLKIVAPEDHPITAGLPRTIRFLDEPYWPMIGDARKVDALATADLDGKPQPMMWTFQKGRGRVFATILGHYTWTWKDPLFRQLLLRSMEWAGANAPAAAE